MYSTSLVLKPVNDLLSYHFIIPDYQRGYRWTPIQVTALLNDIWKFRLDSDNDKKESFYCLQPVVVAKSDRGWVVIDGQQRLTTLHLILTFLKELLPHMRKTRYTIEYQTRPGTEEYLNSPNPARQEDTIDNFYMWAAFKTIQEWFEAQDGSANLGMLQTILNDNKQGKNVKLIWYEVGDDDSTHHIDIFTRLNIGKIPLTNAELIKAVFLQNSNFPAEKASLKQLQIASEWDRIEQKLQQDDFWYFIYDTGNPITYDNRIEYIFDLKYNRVRGNEHYYTFFKFVADCENYKDKNEKTDIDQLWLEIKRYFLTFEEWHSTSELYHMVGFLVCCGVNIKTLKDANHGLTKKEFMEHLYDRIRAQVFCDVDELEYKNPFIKKVLLLFNLQTMRIGNDPGNRFPFDRYKIESWDIEHIHSQTELGIEKRDRKKWMEDVFRYFTGVDLNRVIPITETGFDDYIDIHGRLVTEEKAFCLKLYELYNKANPETSAFEDLYRNIANYLKEDESVTGMTEQINGIGNLALLDENTNRSYKNALFAVKRQRIIENDKTGKFVPICTKNVFLKYYGARVNQLMYWTVKDAQDYKLAIEEALEDFLPPKKPTIDDLVIYENN